MIQVEGNIIDLWNRRIFPGVVVVEEGIIKTIRENSNRYDCYIAPGFVDAHVHIESSMLIPQEFSRLVIQKGTVAIVNDPHEIANVLGVEGINFMIEDSKKGYIKTFFTVPSCVPATSLDYSGNKISSTEVEEMFRTGEFVGLSEMMNVNGVVEKDEEIRQKLSIAQYYGVVVDGHAPGLTGSDLEEYIESGISTDHESVSLEEATEKIEKGMKILIREGSAAKDYQALKSLIALYPDDVMFCTDDSHPHDLFRKGHIDKIVKQALQDGFDLYDVWRIAAINPVLHYKLDVGTLRVGDKADFIVINNPEECDVLSVYIDGKKKYDRAEKCKKDILPVVSRPNLFHRESIREKDLIKPVGRNMICIKVNDHELVTEKVVFENDVFSNNFEADTDRDILKLVYLNRYIHKSPKVAFIHGIGLKTGAFATSISHDSHNIIAVGCSDVDLTLAINKVIEQKGGLVVVNKNDVLTLDLPIAGIMTDRRGEEVADIWETFINELRGMGCCLDSPFMTLSFMALIVIPELKIGEGGLFEFSKFSFIEE